MSAICLLQDASDFVCSLNLSSKDPPPLPCLSFLSSSLFSAADPLKDCTIDCSGIAKLMDFANSSSTLQSIALRGGNQKLGAYVKNATLVGIPSKH